MAHKTIQHVFVADLKLFGPKRAELKAKEVGGFSVMLYGEKAGRHYFAYQHGRRNINV